MKVDDKQILNLLSDEKTLKQGFSLLVRQYSDLLYWKIRRIVLDHEDANDVLQNTFIKVWNNLSSFEGKSSLSTWLYRIAINEALDFLRKRKVDNNVSPDEDMVIANKLMADDYFDGDQTQAMLQEAISKLPDVQKTVFNMKYYDNMKYSEISRILGTSEGALKASYHLAVKKITEYFQRHD